MIQGNIEGVRESVLQDLERLYDAEFGREDFLPDRLLQVLVRYTEQINREMMVYVSRDGNVLEIAIGSLGSVSLPERHLRRNWERLSEIRCIHTHPGGNAQLSDVDIQALRLLRFDAMCSVGVANGIATGITAAFLGDVEYGQLSVQIFGPVKPGRIPQKQWMREIEIADEKVEKANRQLDTVEQAEKVMLISIDSQESLDELAALTQTAGGMVICRELQNRMKPDISTYIGKGKAEELGLRVQAMEIDLVVVDDELTASQQRNLEKVLGARVIDRTALILDIFAGRAQSKEGKLQVELAQMKYRLPRLIGQGTVLSRLGGGIGTRGPGETQLEVDRRRVRKRIDDLTAELAEITKQREMRRNRRKRDEKVTAALVGYTNAGKSTLLNALSGSNVLVEDKLFATLDPVTRKIELPDNRECLLVDTVGFIRKLPHALVEAFKSTLEEALDAELLIIVSDVSSPKYLQEREVVFQVLSELGAEGKPVIEVLNKADRIQAHEQIETRDNILISAREGEGLDRLREAIVRKISQLRKIVEISVPYNRGDVTSYLYDRGKVLAQEYVEEGINIRCELDSTTYQRVLAMLERKTKK